jgi:hypothetical protein
MKTLTNEDVLINFWHVFNCFSDPELKATNVLNKIFLLQ